MRPVPQVGLDLIRAYEKFAHFPYLDQGGIPTIGWGAIWGPDGKRVTMQTPAVTQETAEAMFRRDVARECGPVARLLPVPLADNQYAALCVFCFNVGVWNLRGSGLQSCLLREAYEEAPAQFMRWVYVKGMRSRGLARRRAEEAALFAAA